jgi:hypothetical protein
MMVTLRTPSRSVLMIVGGASSHLSHDPHPRGAGRKRRKPRSAIKRGFDDTLFLRRAHSLGHRRQWVNLLGDALTVNSLTLLEHSETSARSVAA